MRISDVAAAAGVSKSMVSYALNDRPGVKDSTRARIIETAERMGWTPSVRGRALSSSRAYAIGLVFQKSSEATTSDQYYTSLMAGIQSTLSPAGYSLVTEVVDSLESERTAYQRLSRDGRVDGMVVVGPRDDDPRLEFVLSSGLSWVLLGRPPVPTRMPALVDDESQAVGDIVEHLAGFGHTRVAQVVGPQDHSRLRVRRELCQARLRDHGLDDSLWVPGDSTIAGARDATRALLERDPRPTAILFSNDLMAIAGMNIAASMGLRVPEDVSIVGWDDVAIAEYLHPSLSTVTVHPFDDGREAAVRLLEAIQGAGFDEVIGLPDPRFLARESSGPAPA